MVDGFYAFFRDKKKISRVLCSVCTCYILNEETLINFSTANFVLILIQGGVNR